MFKAPVIAQPFMVSALLIMMSTLLVTGCETEAYKETSATVSDALSKTGEAVKSAGKATSDAITDACESVKESMDAENKDC